MKFSHRHVFSIVAAVTMTFGLSTSTVQAQCASDITGDGQINGADLAQLLADWGSCPAGGTCASDITGDGQINGADLAQLLADWGSCSGTITSVTPLEGSILGGTQITITGTFFTGATSVTIGGVAATSVVVVSATTVTAVTPAGAIGAASVVVTTPSGSATLAGGFSYVSPGPWATILEIAPNAAVVTSATLRSAITATGLPWRVRDNSSNIEMLLVPPGTFIMGCSASTSYGCFSGENPTHQVTLTSAFYMGKTEVTQAQWQAEMGSYPSYFAGYGDSPSRPVEQVSWNTIQPFLTQNGLRLPTEAEWEYAYRAGTTTAFHSFSGYPNGTNTDSLLGNIAWYSSNAGSQTHAVAGKYANGFGLYDMSGNVWEWCMDWYGAYSAGAITNPTGPTSGTGRLLRGGSWYGGSFDCRASYRGDNPPGGAGNSIGFRVVRTP